MFTRTALPAALLGILLAHAGWAQPAPANPDWPCMQQLVPRLTAGSYWTGGAVPTGDYTWHDDPGLTHLIQTAVDRDTPQTQAAAALAHYVAGLPKPKRASAASRLFGYIVDESNDERDVVIGRIEQLSRRQRNLDTLISAISTQLDAIPASATGDAAARRTDLSGQRDFNIQTFREAQSTIRYACEVPAMFDRRLGVFARSLQPGSAR